MAKRLIAYDNKMGALQKGDIVSAAMNERHFYLSGGSKEKEYIGKVARLFEGGFFIHYGNTSRPLYIDEIRLVKFIR